MLVRNIMLALGALLLLAGVGLMLIWVNGDTAGPPPREVKQEPQVQEPQAPREAMLEAAHALPKGTLLRSGDVTWKDIDPKQVRPGAVLRSSASEADYLGAITRRAFAAGELLQTDDLVKTGDRRFLAAVLKPGNRAVSIAVDAPQSSSGLILPGDRVDVILTQNLGEAASDPSHKTVAETILKNVPVIAVDQRLNMPAKPGAAEALQDMRTPRTVTLEVSEKDGHKLFVATQLGALQLSVRPLEVSETELSDEDRSPPIWAADVSAALRQASRKQPKELPSGSSLESSIRTPPALAH